MRKVLCLLALTLAGCQAYWTKPGFNQADWNRDKYECERDMRQSGYYGTGIIGAINAQDFFEECLVARGYYKTSAQAPSPPVTQHYQSSTSTIDHSGSSGETAAGDDAMQLERQLRWIQHLKDSGAISNEAYEEDRQKAFADYPNAKH
jgi:hypothetical protein